MSGPKRYKVSSKHLPISLQLRIWAGKILFRGDNVGGGRGTVFRLPAKQVAKLWCSRNELASMEFVQAKTSVPVPRVLEIYEIKDDADGRVHIVMEEAPGGNAYEEYVNMTDEQVATFGSDLADCLEQLRALEPPRGCKVGNTLGKAGLDHRLSSRLWGPFDTITDFHTYLRRGHPIEHWESEPDVVRVHSRPEGTYQLKFTHADLAPRNIKAKNGHITAILDWEFGGWYPEYWDYTKMYWGESEVWENFYRAVEGEDRIVKYPEEKAAELAIWKHMHPFAYDDPPWKPEDDLKYQRAQQGTDDSTKAETSGLDDKAKDETDDADDTTKVQTNGPDNQDQDSAPGPKETTSQEQ